MADVKLAPTQGHRWDGKTHSQRFDEKWVLVPSGCHVWLGAKDKRGYGKFTKPGGGWQFAHRYAYMRKNGHVSSEAIIRHRCDRPDCVNPDHLEVGTQADNIRDMFDRGRAAVGESMPVSKLTNDEVRAIRARHKRGIKQYVLAAEYGVSKMTVSRIVRRELWRHI
jgi:hypothetical protein